MMCSSNAESWRTKGGYLLVLVLVFGSILFVVLSSTLGYVVGQSQVVTARLEVQRAVDIAEAGLNYYRWFLAHYPGDVTNGTNAPGPYVQQYFDPEGAAIGEFSLEVASSTYCGQVASIFVESTGHTYARPALKRTVSVLYSRPTVAEYAYIINSNVWAGPSLNIIGPYHSNGGIRMDGTNLSTVTSGQATWSCTGSFGCTPSGNRNGVFTTTANANQALFSFPSAPINFTGLMIGIAQMKDRAQNAGGIYLPDSGDEGYQINFNSNGTISVRVVDRTWSHDEFSTEAGVWYTANNLIRTLNTATIYTINPDCPLIFAEDKVWIEDSVVNQRVTIAAADPDTPGNDYSMVLNGNITYNSSSSGLLAVAEQDMLVGYDVPNDMTINGIFIAQNGKFGRNQYVVNSNGGSRCRNSLTMNGTIVSNGRVGTQWTGSGCTGGYNSGFRFRFNTYDRDLVENPPPLVPQTSDVYVFRDWREAD
ncbi:hypothetical protein K2Q16_03800 [Patescibacteria group bacterium]|nr:hypothetical protein [Patescibacteria group bacterium]